MSNSLDPDQARRIVGPDLGPNCLPRLSADDTGRQRVKDDLISVCFHARKLKSSNSLFRCQLATYTIDSDEFRNIFGFSDRSPT